MFAQKMKFQNDGNGNSRRGWFLVDDRGHHVGYVDAGGLTGKAPLEAAARTLKMGLVTAYGNGPVQGEYGTIHEVDLTAFTKSSPVGGYSALRKFDLETSVPGRLDGEIVTSSGVPIFGVTEYGMPLHMTVGKCELGRVSAVSKTQALRSLYHGETIAVRGWCRSFRALDGTVSYGRAWLEATCV
jgi:hypothetical protein